MKCNCGADTKVVDTRPDGATQWRRRSCLACGTRFNTVEILESELTPTANKIIEETPKPIKKTPFVSEKTAKQISEKKIKARHFIEDMKYRDKEEEDDLFWNGDYQDELTY